jgi:hypothetical protein
VAEQIAHAIVVFKASSDAGCMGFSAEPANLRSTD